MNISPKLGPSFKSYRMTFYSVLMQTDELDCPTLSKLQVFTSMVKGCRSRALELYTDFRESQAHNKGLFWPPKIPGGSKF